MLPTMMTKHGERKNVPLGLLIGGGFAVAVVLLFVVVLLTMGNAPEQESVTVDVPVQL